MTLFANIVHLAPSTPQHSASPRLFPLSHMFGIVDRSCSFDDDGDRLGAQKK